MRLVDIFPAPSAASLVDRFVPPARFGAVSFDSYVPNPAFPSQAQAKDELERFAAGPVGGGKRRLFGRKAAPTTRPARYLDGGFGVGKTHLLASLWHASAKPASYVTFTELTAFIGFLGMEQAVAAFAQHRLLCIDEFELDDVANTLMVVSFLRGTLDPAKTVPMSLAVTSNTLPDALGAQRFSASDFKREIAAISAYFDEFALDGPDFRASTAPLPLASLDEEQLTHVTHDDFTSVMGHLQKVHPVHYGALLDGVDGVVIEGLEPMRAQDDALLFVQLIDKLYDARIPVKLTGVGIEELFVARYRQGGYRKKYGRAESRMTAMAGESAGIL